MPPPTTRRPAWASRRALPHRPGRWRAHPHGPNEGCLAAYDKALAIDPNDRSAWPARPDCARWAREGRRCARPAAGRVGGRGRGARGWPRRSRCRRRREPRACSSPPSGWSPSGRHELAITAWLAAASRCRRRPSRRRARHLLAGPMLVDRARRPIHLELVAAVLPARLAPARRRPPAAARQAAAPRAQRRGARRAGRAGAQYGSLDPRWAACRPTPVGPAAATRVSLQSSGCSTSCWNWSGASKSSCQSRSSTSR